MRKILATLALSCLGLALCVHSGHAQDKLKPGRVGSSSLIFSIGNVSPFRGVSFRSFYGSLEGKSVSYDGKVGKSLGVEGYPVAISSDGRYLVSANFQGGATLSDLDAVRNYTLPLKYPDRPGLEKYSASAVEVVDGKVTVVGKRTFGSGYGDVVFVWTVGQGVRVIDSFEDLYGTKPFGWKTGIHKVSLSRDGTLLAFGLALPTQNAYGVSSESASVLVGNVGRLAQPLRPVGPGQFLGSPSGALFGWGLGDPSRSQVGASFGTAKWAPAPSRNSKNYRNYTKTIDSSIYLGKFLPDIHGGSPIESKSFLTYGADIVALTDSGFAVVRVWAVPRMGFYNHWEGAYEVIIVSPGEGEFKVNDYLALKGIHEWVDPNNIVKETLISRGVAVVEKDGFRFMSLDGKLFNLGKIPGYVAPPQIKPTATPGAAVM